MPLNLKENTDLVTIQKQWDEFHKTKKTKITKTHLQDSNNQKIQGIKIFLETGSFVDTGSIILLNRKEELNIDDLIAAANHLSSNGRNIESGAFNFAELKWARQRWCKFSKITNTPHISKAYKPKTPKITTNFMALNPSRTSYSTTQ